MRNGADVLLRTLLSAGGRERNAGVHRRAGGGRGGDRGAGAEAEARAVRPSYFAGMMAESAAYAVLFGGLIAAATQVVLGGVVRMAADGGDITSCRCWTAWCSRWAPESTRNCSFACC